jgi:hypothetical protein
VVVWTTTTMMPTTSKTFRVTAHNTAPDSENKIHDNAVAQAYGFRGGLVPGVTVYGYMVPPILEQMGRSWLERGSIAFRLHAPCYEGDAVVSRCDGQLVSAEMEDGSLYASGTVAIIEDEANQPLAGPFPLHPLPAIDQRPVASTATIRAGQPLGSIRQKTDVSEEAGAPATHGFRVVGCEAAIPERLLRMANEILVQNFLLSPWIHAGSHVRHHGLAHIGKEITVSGAIRECFERKGRNFAVAALELSEESRLIATVLHTFIFDLKKTSPAKRNG